MSTLTTYWRWRGAATALLFGCVTLLPSSPRADNPIVQTNYTADPAPMVWGDRLYVHTTHDEDVTVSNFFTMNDWRVYSTADMVNWTDHGSPLSYKDFSWGKGDAWAGQCIPRNGKFYFYVPMNNCCGTKIGVAVSNSPTGPFTDPLGKALISTGSGNIDPTVFIDDDGQAYLYWGNPDLMYVKLNADMISYSGTPTKVSLTTAGFGTRSNTDRTTAYEEGPWFYKRASLYYIVYPADGTPEKISYTTSSGPLGPWTYRGDIMAKESGAGSSFTNHPGVIDFKGKSYFFYHNGALPGGGGYKRSVCVEEFTYNADGTIPTVKMTTTGPAAVATLNPFQQVEAETIAFSSGLKTEICTDTGGGIDVTSINNGDYIKVKNVDFLDGVTSFDARVSSSASNAKIELHLDSQTGTLLGTCDVSGASSWTTKTCVVSGGSGKHDLFMKFVGDSGELFKFNWWKFTGPTMSNPDAGADSSSAGTGGADGGGGVTGTGGSAGGAGGRTSGSSGGSASGGGGGTTTGAGGSGNGGRTAVTGGASGGSEGGAGSGGRAVGTGGIGEAGGGTAGSSTTSGGSSGSTPGGGGTGVSKAGGAAGSSVGASSGSAGCSCRVGASRGGDGRSVWCCLFAFGLFLGCSVARMRRSALQLTDARGQSTLVGGYRGRHGTRRTGLSRRAEVLHRQEGHAQGRGGAAVLSGNIRQDPSQGSLPNPEGAGRHRLSPAGTSFARAGECPGD